MSEVQRRSFDLNSSAGLTDLLQYARKSTLDPLSYASLRDVVLEYAQQKGSNPELKRKIEETIASLTTLSSRGAEAPPPAAQKKKKRLKKYLIGKRVAVALFLRLHIEWPSPCSYVYIYRSP
jgi:hypothetical protein